MDLTEVPPCSEVAFVKLAQEVTAGMKARREALAAVVPSILKAFGVVQGTTPVPEEASGVLHEFNVHKATGAHPWIVSNAVGCTECRHDTQLDAFTCALKRNHYIKRGQNVGCTIAVHAV
jgi:hypothetical protein